MRHRAERLAAVTAGALLALALTLALTTGPASAHTSLEAASPAIGSTVSPPSKIVLTYLDPVRFPQVVLTDAAGKRHESGKARAVDNVVTEQVAGTLPSGVYTVGWRVVATDGHPVSGQYTFTVKSGTGSVSAKSAPVKAQGSEASGTGWWWIGLGALLVAGLAIGIVFVRRSLGHDTAP